MKGKILLLFLVPIFIFGKGYLDPKLEEALKKVKGNEKIGVIVRMKDQVNWSKLEGLGAKQKVEYMRELTKRSQRDILEFLSRIGEEGASNVKSFWIINGFRADLTKNVILSLLEREDVWYIQKIKRFKIFDANKKPKGVKGPRTHYPELPKKKHKEKEFNWNIRIIMADSVWLNLGIDGSEVIVGNLDTGVDVDHPALQGKFLGYWFDGVNGQPNPYDDHGHGTHTMGTIVGGDGPGSQLPDNHDVGVAYGANFVAAKGFDSGGWGQDDWILACYEWYVSLVVDSGVPVRVVSNSWGTGSSDDLTFWDATYAWRQVGIIPVFSIGNSGSSPGSANAPGNFPIVIGVGATDSDDDIAGFSSRGPAPDQSPWNDPQYWPFPEWNLLKPDISAPGVNVLSCLPGGLYGEMTGTSMAAPHVAGVITLMLSMNPSLDFETVYNIITTTADEPPQGAPYPNNNYGFGRINAYQALLNTPTLNAPFVRLARIQIDDSMGNGNGIADPGETVTLFAILRNLGAKALNVEATLTTVDTTITIIDGNSFYGTIEHGDTVSGDGFVFTSDSSRVPGLPAEFYLFCTGQDTSGSTFTYVDTFTISIGTPAYNTWFFDDFEGGLGQWGLGGTSLWSVTSSTSHSPFNSATDSPYGDYGNNEHKYMVTVTPIDLSDAHFARVIFWHKYEIEQGWDFGYVQVATDSSDNAQWYNVATYTGNQSDWVAETLDLSGMVGEPQVYLRFLLETDGSITRDGWYIDDVEIQKDVPFEGIHIALQGYSLSDSTGGNANGIIDPGETIEVIVTLRNMGTDLAQNVVATLIGSDSYISLIDSTTAFGDIQQNEMVSNEDDPFTFSVDPNTPMGYTFTLNLVVTAEPDFVDTFYLNFNVAWGGDYIIWDPDETPSSGPLLDSLLKMRGFTGIYTADLSPYADFLINFGALFVCVGIYPHNHVIDEGSPEAQAIVNYLNSGGRVYLEGGDVWYYDPLTGGFNFNPYFGITPIEDGSGDLSTVNGMEGTFTSNMSFYYNGENSWIDHIEASGTGFNIFSNSNPFYYCGVANVASGTGGAEYRTVGLSFEFAGLQDGTPPSTKDALLDSIVAFFGLETKIGENTGKKTATLSLEGPTPTITRENALITLSLPVRTPIEISLFDVAGRKVKLLLMREMGAGLHRLNLNLKAIPQGVYFVRVEVGKKSFTKKLIILR